MTKEMFKSIAEWQKETFGQATSLSKIHHLREEIAELETAIILNKRVGDLDKEGTEKFLLTYKDIEMEFADCFILLFGAASCQGFSYDDICRVIYEKMLINRNRKWGKPKENGVVNHIKS